MDNRYPLHPEAEIFRISLYRYQLNSNIEMIMSLSKDSFLQRIALEIEMLYGISVPDYTDEKQLTYILSSAFSGIYRKNLCVTFQSGKAVGYTVSYHIVGKKIF